MNAPRFACVGKGDQAVQSRDDLQASAVENDTIDEALQRQRDDGHEEMRTDGFNGQRHSWHLGSYYAG